LKTAAPECTVRQHDRCGRRIDERLKWQRGGLGGQQPGYLRTSGGESPRLSVRDGGRARQKCRAHAIASCMNQSNFCAFLSILA
jgi:hypothetical protein